MREMSMAKGQCRYDMADPKAVTHAQESVVGKINKEWVKWVKPHLQNKMSRYVYRNPHNS
jgi:hypothetical protein